MRKLLKQFFNSFLSLNKSEQRGIVVLSILIILMIIANQLLPFFIHHTRSDQSGFLSKVKTFQKDQKRLADSIQLEKLQARGQLDSISAYIKLKPFPFNPNDLAEEKWLALGLSKKQIATIKNYEQKGGQFRSKEDVRKIYGISEIEYQILEPYILIPPSENKKPQKSKKKAFRKNPSKKLSYSLVEINKADSAMLVSNLKLSPWISQRTIKFRNLLGGFYSTNQLYEVYGLDSSEVSKRMKFIKVDSSQIQKININLAVFKKLLKHPYISYNLTQNIVDYRIENGSFNSIFEVVEQGLVSDSLYQKLKHYLIVK